MSGCLKGERRGFDSGREAPFEASLQIIFSSYLVPIRLYGLRFLGRPFYCLIYLCCGF